MTSTAVSESTVQLIRAMDTEFVRNVNGGDVAALVSAFCAEDANVLPPHAPIVAGAAAIREFWQGMISAGLRMSVLEANRIEESGDLAYGSGVYELTVSPPGKGIVSDKGKYVVVYRRQPDGSWKAVADIFNSCLPG